MKTFQKYLIEDAPKPKPAKPNGPKMKEFDQKPFVDSAMKWLETKYGKELYSFKHQPNLEVENMKSYNVSTENKNFIITGRAFDTNKDGVADTVLFKIKDVNAPEPEEEPDF